MDKQLEDMFGSMRPDDSVTSALPPFPSVTKELLTRLEALYPPNVTAYITKTAPQDCSFTLGCMFGATMVVDFLRQQNEIQHNVQRSEVPRH